MPQTINLRPKSAQHENTWSNRPFSKYANYHLTPTSTTNWGPGVQYSIFFTILK